MICWLNIREHYLWAFLSLQFLIKIVLMNMIVILCFIWIGATDYPCFRGLLKQLVGPLSTQLADRRSSIVKQVSHISLSFCMSVLFLFWIPWSNLFVLVNSSFLLRQCQGCHLLCFLSKELLGDFEACAEMFIPVSSIVFRESQWS